MKTPWKIAFLAEACSAGVGRHVIDAAIGLAEAGHDLHVIYSPTRIDGRFSSGLGRLKSLGAKTLELQIAHNPHPSDLKAVWSVRRYLRKNGPFDILHSHSTKAGLIGRLAAIGKVPKSVYTPHAFLTMSPVCGSLRKMGTRCMEWCLGSVSQAIICVSLDELHHALTLGLDRRKLFHVANGIDLTHIEDLKSERQSLRRTWGLHEDNICIGFVGRMFPQKAPEVILQAFSILDVESLRQARLVLVGDGPLKPALEETVKQLNLEGKVHFVGAVDGLKAMSAFDIFALPSSYEGFPYVLVEAVAMGLPIVTTSVGGASALVRQSENGFIVPVGAVSEMAQSLQLLISSASLREKLAENSLKLSKSFTAHQMLKETESVYQTILGAEQLTAELDVLSN